MSIVLVDEIELGIAGPPGYGVSEAEWTDLLADVAGYESRITTLESDLDTAEATIASHVATIAALKTGLRYQYVIDGGGSAISTGVKGDLEISHAGEFKGWALLADQIGSISIELWRDTYANYPPTVADLISGTTGSNNPRISSSNKAASSSLTNWTTAFSAGDILRFNVVSVTSITRVTIALRYDRT
jgi:hypothetical protein